MSTDGPVKLMKPAELLVPRGAIAARSMSTNISVNTWGETNKKTYDAAPEGEEKKRRSPEGHSTPVAPLEFFQRNCNPRHEIPACVCWKREGKKKKKRIEDKSHTHTHRHTLCRAPVRLVALASSRKRKLTAIPKHTFSCKRAGTCYENTVHRRGSHDWSD